MVRHPLSKKFLRSGLFDGLRNFRELERRIEELKADSEGATKKLRGDAFEVFASAYLATQRQHDAETVWPLSEAPSELLKTTRLAGRDLGVDGLFKTPLGKVSAYQVKFRTGRPALTWQEISTFMGLTDSPNLANKVLFTNCDDITSVINERTAFFCVRGADLDRMQASDFEAIKAWLNSSSISLARKEPLPHQKRALEDLLPALAEHDRVTSIMACGTGKTLVALWLAEQRKAKHILVLLPSLALIRQTLHEWLRESSIANLAYMCVCSDPSVAEEADSLRTNQSDLDFRVSTKPADVAEFLDAPFEGVKIIFSTYQSAWVVGTAAKGRQGFDLGIFDEAHKTAGRDGSNNAFALSDENIPIEKRVFMTATPRHYNPHKRDREGDASLVFSMDRPSVYGPRVHTLTFAEAARQGIICPYRIIISVITSETLTNELLNVGEVLVKGNPVKARTVANLICLRDAVDKYGVSKIFTFHKTVKSAAAFTSAESSDFERHLPLFEGFHVNGDMPTTHRERQMSDFRRSERGIMSNARCLTEGVDVPSVDMVAFLSPRRSKVDIVQATGRAMRKAPGKTTGYILLPVYVELADGETVDDAVARADFGEVWDVLNSLQEQDDVLADVVANYAVSKATRRKLDDERLRERIHVVGPLLTTENIRDAVTTHCLSQFAYSWHENYANLVEFRDRHGHCDVNDVPEAPQSLRSWVSAQRVRNNKGLLSPFYVSKLNEIGFTWDWQKVAADRTWMEYFEKLKVFYSKNGHSNVPRTHEDSKLASWVWIQRQRRSGTYKSQSHIEDRQVELLDSLGFQWDRREEIWEAKFSLLKAFLEKNTWSDLVSAHTDKSLRALYVWCHTQRVRRRKNLLPARKIQKLESIGFRWDAPSTSEAWDKQFEELKKFKEQNGHCRIPHRRGQKSQNNKLAAWSTNQRQLRNAGGLNEEQISKLDSLGFEWKLRERGTWDATFQELVSFVERHGHFSPPRSNKKLAGFVNHCRFRFSKGTLSEERRLKLEAINFPWSAKTAEAAWEERFAELEQFKIKHGHCKVPIGRLEFDGLGRWLSSQKSARRRGKLSAHGVSKLSNLGIDWGRMIVTPRGRDSWNKKFDRLREFHKSHGHTRLTSKEKDLQHWLYVQRQRMRSKILNPERTEMLRSLGVDETALLKTDTKSQDHWRHLLEFKAEHGHCRVPRDYDRDPQLYFWLSQQRSKARKGRLDDGRLRLLEELGVEVGAARPVGVEPWETRYAQLVEFKSKNGHCYIPARWQENPTLGTWVHQQRTKIRSGKLAPEKAEKLIALGINDNSTRPRSRWDDNYEDLKSFHAENGHCKVPWEYPPNRALRDWSEQQLKKIRAKQLPDEKVRLLAALGLCADSQNS